LDDAGAGLHTPASVGVAPRSVVPCCSRHSFCGFSAQEPGTEEEISSFACERFKTTFPLFAKVDVNGPKEAPLYTYLKAQKGGWVGRDIGWNFAKFLVRTAVTRTAGLSCWVS
jgi:glutathione peroxidase-family protein